MAKKFAWCVNTPGKYEHFEAMKSDRSDAIARSFQERVDGYFFSPELTWATGRNQMYEYFGGGGYEYIVFMDDDAVFEGMSHEEGFRRFEALLDEFHPLVASPRYSWHLKDGHLDLSRRVQGLIAASACLHALHRDCWWVLLPYWPEYDHLSWWNAEHLCGRLTPVLWHGATIQFNELAIDNTRKGTYQTKDKCRSADAMMLEMLRPEWRKMVWPHNTPESFTSPPVHLRDSYAITRNDVGRYFDLNHRYWQRRHP
jgi:glycosyltransferase involved in cell wall biosynthesis